MLQLVYVSSARPHLSERDVTQILAASRRNNGRESIGGLLYFDGGRFLQVLEGPQANVLETFHRIGADDRHRAVVIQSSQTIETPQFGTWSMAYRMTRDPADNLVAAIERLVGNASPKVRGIFEGFARIRAAA